MFYKDQSYLTYECKLGSFGFGITSDDISEWKSTGINNYSSDSNMNAIVDSGGHLPNIKNDGRIHVHKCTYDTCDKNNYKGYGICFDERSQFGHTITENGVTDTSNGRNVLIFAADMSFSAHATNKANHIYLMGDGLTQGINDTTIYAEKKSFKNFTEPNVKFVLSLHYHINDSYLFVNGRQELKFKAKIDQLVKEKLYIGNVSDQWTTTESEKTGLYGTIYDFVIDYEEILLLKTIYDIHRYLMIKHDIIIP